MDSYYITAYRGRILSALCTDDDGMLQASFSRIAAPGEKPLRIGSIIVAKMTRRVNNISAAFVELAPGVQGFLPGSAADNAQGGLPIPALRESGLFPVQIERAAVKTKEAVVTTALTLPGKYLVLTLSKGEIRYSEKASKKQQACMREWLSASAETADLAARYGFIIRTNAFSLEDKSPVLEEMGLLSAEMDRILAYADQRTLYSVLYAPPEDYLIQLRDTYSLSYERIVTDLPEVYEQLKAYFTRTRDTGNLERLSFFDTGKKIMSLLNFYRLGEELQKALDRHVWLKSGAYLIIEPTESLTAIDVNTGKYTGKSRAEDTFLKINLEAAREIARQIRLRNLSGMIIVDFINMRSPENNALLLGTLREYAKKDPVHTSVVDMTPLGLVEITRKKIRKSLKEQYDETAVHASD